MIKIKTGKTATETAKTTQPFFKVGDLVKNVDTGSPIEGVTLKITSVGPYDKHNGFEYAAVGADADSKKRLMDFDQADEGTFYGFECDGDDPAEVSGYTKVSSSIAKESVAEEAVSLGQVDGVAVGGGGPVNVVDPVKDFEENLGKLEKMINIGKSTRKVAKNNYKIKDGKVEGSIEEKEEVITPDQLEPVKSEKAAKESYPELNLRPVKFSKEAFEAVATELDASLPKELLMDPSEVNFKRILGVRAEAERQKQKEEEARVRRAEAEKKAAPIIEKIKAAPKVTKINSDVDQMSVAFQELVPGNGKAETLAGEIIRAAMRIIYRWWNDGDYFFEGYGMDTAAPSVEWLVENNVMDVDFFEDMTNETAKFMPDDDYGEKQRDATYERYLIEFANLIIEYVLNKPELFTEVDFTDSRDGDEDHLTWVKDIQPKYDYDVEIPEEVMKHINAGNITTEDLESEVYYWEPAGMIGDNSDEIYVQGDYLYIIGTDIDLYKEISEQKPGQYPNMYKWLQEYGQTLDNEYGDPDEEEDEQDYDEDEEIAEESIDSIDPIEESDEETLSLKCKIAKKAQPDPYIESFGQEPVDESIGSWIAAKKLKKLNQKGLSKDATDEEKAKFKDKKERLTYRAKAGAVKGDKPNATQKVLDEARKEGQRSNARRTNEIKADKKKASLREDIMKKLGVSDEKALKDLLNKAGISAKEEIKTQPRVKITTNKR